MPHSRAGKTQRLTGEALEARPPVCEVVWGEGTFQAFFLTDVEACTSARIELSLTGTAPKVSATECRSFSSFLRITRLTV